MFLIDTSALIRFQRRQAHPVWDELGDRGLLAVCEPVLAETLVIAAAKDYERVEARILDQYPWVTVPDNIWAMVAAIRRELAPHSAHQGVSLVDLLVAATAIRLKLELLHEDGDFETIARFVPELKQRRVSAGAD
ncbi:MAG: hypothetical protein AUG44_13800 [Actinobacteria bacterium 13_1_20CM_3_71_11]|nr:MAG: hypothetical protein AUG44_13800 [Actinobacteria bacterium 13_1_20CM_3_71_11]